MPNETTLLALLAVVGVLLVLQTLRLQWRRGRGARHAARARRLGAEGEANAERLLRAAGYAIVARQVTARYALEVDGGSAEVLVRADFLVERGRARYVADAKGGERASRITDRATRRQLLEYLHAYDVDGALLVDATRGEVHLVRRGVGAARARRPALALFGLGVLVGALVGALAGVWAARAAIESSEGWLSPRAGEARRGG